MSVANQLREKAAEFRRQAEVCEQALAILNSLGVDGEAPVAAKRRGRKPGSKNKPKEEAPAAEKKAVAEGGKRRGRPPGVKNKPKENAEQPIKLRKPKAAPAEAAEPKVKRAKNDIPLPKLVVDILSKHKKGLQLHEVVDLVLAAGYKSSTKKEGGFSQIVYQTLHKLMTADDKLVDRDDDARYKLVKAA